MMLLDDLKSDNYKLNAAVSETRPLPFSVGSYFRITAGPWSIPILNMHTEEFQRAIDEYFTDGRVWVRIWRNDNELMPEWRGYWGCIDDGRIPKDWYSRKLCWLGAAVPTIETAKEIFAFHRDESDEIEQFTNPYMYWEKRGGIYEIGRISFNG